MKKLTSILLSLLVLLSSLTPALAWGPDGHTTVGQIAVLRVNSHTKSKLAQILRPGETLATVANWADSVKNRVGKHDPDPDTDAFLQDTAHNSGNGNWHFDDLPLGCSTYDTCTGFTPDDDVVHLINICIRTLQGQPDQNQPLNKRNALRMLVHLVGDLHQPLHLGSGYINEDGPNHTIVIVKDPGAVTSNTASDRGANALIIDGQKKNLHSFWDGDLVHMLMTQSNKSTPNSLAQFLKTSVSPKPEWSATGDIDTWASQWATDSLHVSANKAFNSVRIVGGRRIVNGKPAYNIRRSNNYNSLNVSVVREQLAKGGFRLAKLLDAIFAN